MCDRNPKLRPQSQVFQQSSYRNRMFSSLLCSAALAGCEYVPATITVWPLAKYFSNTSRGKSSSVGRYSRNVPCNPVVIFDPHDNRQRRWEKYPDSLLQVIPRRKEGATALTSKASHPGEVSRLSSDRGSAKAYCGSMLHRLTQKHRRTQSLIRKDVLHLRS